MGPKVNGYYKDYHTYTRKGWSAAPTRETFDLLLLLPWATKKKYNQESHPIKMYMWATISNLVDTKIVSNSCPLFIIQPDIQDSKLKITKLWKTANFLL